MSKSDELYTFVSPVVAFTSRNHHTTNKKTIHPHFLRIRLVKRKFSSEFLRCETDSRYDASPLTKILRYSSRQSIVIYPIYTHDIRLLLSPNS